MVFKTAIKYNVNENVVCKTASNHIEFSGTTKQINEFIFQGGMQQTQIFTLTALLKNDIKGILRSFIN